MTTQSSSLLDSSINQRPKKPLVKKTLAILIGLCSICCLSSFIFEIFPRYLVVDFPPPDYADDSLNEYKEDWDSTIYSVKLEPLIPPLLISRVFVWRREAIIDTHEIRAWQSIVTYFDDQFGQKGWEQTEVYTPCDQYMPEARFLPRGKDGYVAYRPKGWVEPYDFFGGNFICLAVWGKPNETWYNVTFITISQSPLNVAASYH